MALHLEDSDVEELAERLARDRRITKLEAVRTALQNELARNVLPPAWREELRELQERARRMAGPNPMPITKEWIDSLYEDD